MENKKLIVLLAVLCLVAAVLYAVYAFGDESDPTSPNTGETDNPDQPVSTPAGPGSPGTEPGYQLVQPRPGMIDVRPIPWTDYEVLDDRTIRVFFTSGVEPCYVLDRVEVAYNPDTVTVTLYQGTAPDARDTACIEIAVEKAVDVTLEEPLGGRTVVDGAG